MDEIEVALTAVASVESCIEQYETVSGLKIRIPVYLWPTLACPLW